VKARYRLAFILLFSLASLPSPRLSSGRPPNSLPQGANESATIVGFVRDANTHEAIQSARVDITSASGQTSTNHYTSTNGGFSLNSRDGNYQVIVQKQGYQTAKVDVSVVSGHQVRVDVDLQPVNPEATPSSSETVTAHQLTVPHKARDEYNKGSDLMRKQDYAGAIAQFQKAIAEYPPYYESFAKMGVAQYLLGDAPTAQDSLQKSIELSSGKFPDALFDMADVLNNIHDYANAEPQARKGIAADDASWRGYFELARALTGLKRYPEAEKSATKSRDLNAKNPQLYVVLTNIHLATHDYAAAIVDIDAYLNLDPDSPSSQQMRATRERVAKALGSTPTPASAPATPVKTPE
jgi:tetratricopeptide (TPR) repeat protein